MFGSLGNGKWGFLEDVFPMLNSASSRWPMLDVPYSWGCRYAMVSCKVPRSSSILLGVIGYILQLESLTSFDVHLTGGISKTLQTWVRESYGNGGDHLSTSRLIPSRCDKVAFFLNFCPHFCDMGISVGVQAL